MKNKMTPILLIIAVLAIGGVVIEQTAKTETVKPEPIDATIVAVYRNGNDTWSTSLKWGWNDNERGSWGGKPGSEGERVKIYRMPDGKYQITP